MHTLRQVHTRSKILVNLEVYNLILFFKLQKHNYTKNINIKRIPTREGFEEK
jgi:hypothetical protein